MRGPVPVANRDATWPKLRSRSSFAHQRAPYRFCRTLLASAALPARKRTRLTLPELSFTVREALSRFGPQAP
jgi:hypothetical protein